MRRAFALVGALIAVLSIAVGAASGISRPQTFSVLEIDESDATVNQGFDFQRPPKPGDRFGFKSGLYEWAGVKRGKRIGHDEGLCTFTRVPATFNEQSVISANCAASFFLPGGQVYAGGFLHLGNGPLDTDIPILGGTGIYANARGWAHVHDLGNGDIGHTNITFHLLP